MIYTEHIGKVYDTICYAIICFNRESMEKRIIDHGLEMEGAFSFYEEVNNYCKPLPDCISPLFYYDSVNQSFATAYFRNFFNFHENSFDDFYNLLLNKEKLKKEFVDFMFINLSEEERNKIITKDSEAIYNISKSQNWSDELMKNIVCILHHFDYAHNKLMDNIKIIHKHIRILHENHRDKINLKITESKSKDSLTLFKDIYSFSSSKINNMSFSLSFLNQYIILNENSGRKEYVFLLGNRYKDRLKILNGNIRISLKEALEILGNRKCFEIIECLKKHDKLTQSDLCRLLSECPSQISRSVSSLLAKRVILESHKDGRKVYFTLNNDYINLFKKSINDFL